MNHRDERLGSAPLGKLMFSLAVPSVAAQLINVLYNIVDRIYVPATGRYAYVDNSAYGTTIASGVNLTGQYKKFKSNTIIYSNSNLAGAKYYYLPKTRVKVIADYGNVNKIYVPATGRYGFVSENVY